MGLYAPAMKPLVPALIIFLAFPALADTARVIDGDTLEWKGERIRLMGSGWGPRGPIGGLDDIFR